MHRIISLLPAGTEIVAALGASDSLVGISHECDYPVEVTRLPRVTTSAVARDADSSIIDAEVRRLSESGLPVFALDATQIADLAPTLILTQTLCEVCAVSDGDVRDIAHVISPAPRILPLVGTTLEGVWADIASVGGALDRSDVARGLIDALLARLRAVHETLKAARAPRPRVAVIEWLDPLFIAGHWTPEVVRKAGGIDVLAEPGDHSVQLDVAQLRDTQPELLFFAPCGFDVDRAERDSRALLATDQWRWARDIESWAIDGNALTSRPGPRLADAVEVLAAIFAPSLFSDPPAHYARRLALRTHRAGTLNAD